jgi:hypothetical protein
MNFSASGQDWRPLSSYFFVRRGEPGWTARERGVYEIMQTAALTWVRSALVCVFALTLAACLRPYKTSVFDPSTAQFPGITSEWHGKSGGDIRVLFVHGICTHDEKNWITDGWDPVIKGYFPAVVTPPVDRSLVGQVQIVDQEYQVGTKKISGRYLLWSPLTASDKAKLNYDNRPTDSPGGEFSWKRAKINGNLKATLLNDCLSDAVIYAGYRGGTDIQVAMQNAICAALDGTPTSSACDFPATYRHGGRRIVIVTESLGSRMVFDAISALKIEAQGKPGNAALDAFEEAVAPITQIYMLANQLPILALARPALVQASSTTEPSNSKTPAMATALNVLHDARVHHQGRHPEDGQPPKLSLVAFTDPNDLLSYRLQPNDPAVVGADTRVVNVITSNDYSYFGLVENPLTAHEGYDLNKDVLRLLLGGSAREK